MSAVVRKHWLSTETTRARERQADERTRYPHISEIPETLEWRIALRMRGRYFTDDDYPIGGNWLTNARDALQAIQDGGYEIVSLYPETESDGEG